MVHSSHNLLHDWKSARLEKQYISQVGFLGSGIRTTFLHAWVITVVKVLLVFAFMNYPMDYTSKIEENVSLLDQYINNEYYVIDTSPFPFNKSREVVPVIKLTTTFQPRGPSAEVAGDTTDIPN